VPLRDWALELMDSMRGICEILDEDESGRPYVAALETQEAKIYDAALTPSARSLTELKATDESFIQFALRMSQLHKSYFLELYPPNERRLGELENEAKESLARQAHIESTDTLPFDEYLARYFARPSA